MRSPRADRDARSVGRFHATVMSERPLTEPHPNRLPVDHPLREQILAAHEAAMTAAAPGYTDPATGLVVFTASYLAERGYCCESGCRHCPYV